MALICLIGILLYGACGNEKKKTAEHFMYLNNFSNIYNNVKLFSFIYTYLL